MINIDLTKEYDGMTPKDLCNLIQTLKGLGWSDDRINALLRKYEQAEENDQRRDRSV